MSTAFIKAVQQQYPDAIIDVIVKKGIDFLLDYFPKHNQHFIFDKEVYKGISGAFKFGKQLRQQKRYDIFFCLPDSLSSAVMAFGVDATQRIGYKKELRSVLLTNSYQKKKNIHRVEEYVDLLKQFIKTEVDVSRIISSSTNNVPSKNTNGAPRRRAASAAVIRAHAGR